MAGLVAIWIGLGLLAGLLAHPARLWPAAWGRWSWLALAGCGAGGALLGAILTALLLGLLFATPAALATALLVAVAGPWLVARAHRPV